MRDAPQETAEASDTEMADARGPTRILLLFTFVAVVWSLPDVIRIGGLFDGKDANHELAFRYSVEKVNANRNVLPRSRLVATIERLPSNDSFNSGKKVCQLMRNGVAAILGPSSVSTAAHVQSMCDAMEIPHIDTRWESRIRRAQYTINLHPHPSSLSKAYWDVVSGWGWKTFTILYEEQTALTRLQDLMRASTLTGHKVIVRQLPQNKDYRTLFKDIQQMEEKFFVLDCAAENIATVLKQAQQVGLITSSYSFFITSLDLHTVDLEDYKYGGTNITGLRMVDPTKTETANVVGDWIYGERRYGANINLDEKTLTTSTALTYDAVQLFAKALTEFDRSQEVNIKSLNCDGSDTWVHGNSLVNYMKLVEMEGLTGFIKFDPQGLRTFFHLNVLELSPEGLQVVGLWNPIDRANFTRMPVEMPEQPESTLRNKTLRVSSKLSDPYFMLKESSDMLTGNDRFEGFVFDVIDEISKMLGFNYTFQIVEDGNYGSLNKETGKWNGMIKELLDGKTDFAIADLSINYEREQAVDFTLPFMNTGISILYKKPQKQPPSLFSFLAPMSMEVWITMCSAYVGVSLIMFVLARLTPFEWVNPHPCDPEPEELENSFTILDSMWFTIGSLMQQGSDIAPRATSTRMVAGLWWFFTMIMISSYTANLAAFLTVEQLETPISSAEDLAKQTKIKYGSVGSGSTLAFFRDSTIPTYQRMWKFMESTKPDVFTKSNMEGVERVQRSNGQYAFMMESSSIEFFTERKCDLTQIGGLIDSKGYGIALRPGSPYLAELSQAVLKMQETNRLLILKNKWWREKRGGGLCKDADSGSGGASELGLANVGGVFMVLIGGVLVASVICVFEFIWETRKLAREEGEPFWNTMVRELREALKCSGNTKPVKRPPESKTPS